MPDYTVRFYGADGKCAAMTLLTAESDLAIYSRVNEQLQHTKDFQSAEILRNGELVKTIIGS